MGLLSQLGLAREVTYGTAVAPDRFLEFVSESLALEKFDLSSEGIRGAGRSLRRGSRRKIVGRQASGNVDFELGPDDFGIFFELALGAVATATPGGATTAREHTFTIGQLGESVTVQKGVEGDANGVQVLNYVGCMVRELNLSAASDEYVRLRVTLDARDEGGPEVLPLEVAAYTADAALFAADGVTISAASGADLAKAQSFDLTIANQLSDRSRTQYLSSGGLKGQPRSEGYPMISGTIGLRFDQLSDYHDAFEADTSLNLTFQALTGDTIEAGQDEELTIDLADVRFGGTSPQVGGPQVPDVSVPFEVFEPAAGEAITVVLRNGDTTP